MAYALCNTMATVCSFTSASYRDQFALVNEALIKERKDIEIKDQAQSKVGSLLNNADRFAYIDVFHVTFA